MPRQYVFAVTASLPLDDCYFPPVLSDSRDVPSDPLDVRDVTFGQRDTQLWLKLRTQGNWSAADLADYELCSTLILILVIGLLCVGATGHAAAAIRYARIASNGIVEQVRPVAAALIQQTSAHCSRALALAPSTCRTEESAECFKRTGSTQRLAPEAVMTASRTQAS